MTDKPHRLQALFSSEKEDWETPNDLYEQLHKIFGFKLDAFASAENAKCKRYFTKDDDALTQDWGEGPVFWNPPYGRAIGPCVKKAYEESLKGTTSVGVLPARTDTRWYNDYVSKGTVFFVRGRLKFGGAKNSAPFPSLVVIFWGSEYLRSAA